MISLSTDSRIYICTTPIDFRNGIDGLIGLTRSLLKLDPLSGVIILYRSKSKTSIKILAYDGQGFWLHQKRLSEGKFKWWPRDGTLKVNLTANELYIFLANGDPEKAQLQKNFR